MLGYCKVHAFAFAQTRNRGSRIEDRDVEMHSTFSMQSTAAKEKQYSNLVETVVQRTETGEPDVS